MNNIEELKEIGENIKIEKEKTYTGAMVKKIFDKAVLKTMNKTGDDEDTPAKVSFIMLMNGVILFHQLEDNLFEKEEK